MRKCLLLAAAAVMTATAVSAQPTVVKSAIAANAQEFQTVNSCAEAYAEKATAADPISKIAPKATPTAWYNRPRGSFYRSLSATGGAFYNPSFFSPAYRDVTYPNASTNATSYKWELDKYNSDVDSFETVTSTETDYTGNFIRESAYAPTLTASDGTNSDTYQLHAQYYNSSSKTNTDYTGIAYYVLDPYATMQAGSTAIDAFVGPKLFSAGTRQGNIPGTYYYTGAKDADGGTTGKWFGKNYSGYNALAIYIEKPSIPYGIRTVRLNYVSSVSKVTGDATIYATVYKVNKVQANSGRGDSLALGDVVAQGSIKLDTTFNNQTNPVIDIPLTEEEDGLVSEVEPTIDYDIAVVVYGYDNANVSDFSLVIANDEYDEGYGDCGFMCHVDANGNVTDNFALSTFFKSSVGYTAPSVFVDVEWPLLEYYWLTYGGQPYEPTDSWAAPTAGGTHKVEYYSTKSSDYWSVLQADGSELPSWLTYELQDSIVSGSYAYKTNITYTAAALPTGVSGRSCNIVVCNTGNKVNYTITQGESGINVVETADKQVATRRYFNVAGQQAAEPFEGVNVVETVYTDGTTSTEKVLK